MSGKNDVGISQNTIIENTNTAIMTARTVNLLRRHSSRNALYARNKNPPYGASSCFEGFSMTFPSAGAAISAANQLSIIEIATT